MIPKPTPRIYPFDTLTVVIRDDAPMLHAGDSPSYRSVRIALTDEQIGKIKLAWSHSSGGNHYYEQVSKCFLESEAKAQP